MKKYFLILFLSISNILLAQNYVEYYRNAYLAEYYFKENIIDSAIYFQKQAFKYYKEDLNKFDLLAKSYLLIGDTVKTFAYLRESCLYGAKERVQYLSFSKYFTKKDVEALKLYKNWEALKDSNKIWNLKTKENYVDKKTENFIDSLIKEDQRIRSNDSLFMMYAEKIDKQNINALDSLVKQKGWPGKKVIGNDNVLLLLFHAPENIQKKYVKLLKKEVFLGNIEPNSYAAFVDDYLLDSGQKLIYGMRCKTNKKTGQKQFYDMIPINEVIKNRKEIGLLPIKFKMKLKHCVILKE